MKRAWNSRSSSLSSCLSSTQIGDSSLLPSLLAPVNGGRHDEATIAVFQQAAEEGFPTAQLALAQIYAARRAGPKDLIQAARILESSQPLVSFRTYGSTPTLFRFSGDTDYGMRLEKQHVYRIGYRRGRETIACVDSRIHGAGSVYRSGAAAASFTELWILRMRHRPPASFRHMDIPCPVRCSSGVSIQKS